MEEFLKELTELCKKHNKYIIGCGKEDETSMSTIDNYYCWFSLNRDTNEYHMD